MVCPFCTSSKTSVYNSRQTSRLNSVWRRRKCDACGKVFTTNESVDPGSVVKVAGHRTIRPFLQTKLLLSIFKVFDHSDNAENDAQYITQNVLQKLYRLAQKNDQIVSKEEIANTILETLKPYNLPAYVKYLSYHAPNIDQRGLNRILKS